MNKKKPTIIYHRRIERVLLLCVTLLLVVMAFQFYWNLQDKFEQAEEGYKKGTVVNLTPNVQQESVKQVLAKGGYFTDESYVQFITSHLINIIQQEGPIPNLGALNKKNQWIEASLFNKVRSEAGKLRFLNAITALGMDSALYAQEKSNPEKYSSVVEVDSGKSGINIKGNIRLSDSGHTVSSKGILVRLTEILPEAYYDTLPEAKQFRTQVYARTDEQGQFAFTNVKPRGNYSVQPLKPGYDFGPSKGVVQVSGDQTFQFNGYLHRIRLLDATEYRQIRNDQVFTIRTPGDFTNEFLFNLFLFIIAYWFFHACLWLKNYKSDQFILPILMLLTGVGVIALYAMQDPLIDMIHASGMAKCSSAVLILLGISVFFLKNNPINRLYHSRWFDPVSHFLFSGNRLKAPRGYSWLLLSILLMLALLVLGTGPEGSGVKVNLFGLQVSELSKLLMVIFFAAYFSVNADYFSNIPDNRWLMKNSIYMFILFLFLLLIYGAIGDLGPAVVLCLTFLFFYSFAKNEFFIMMLAAVIYTVILLIAGRFLQTTEFNYMPWLALVACAGTFILAWQKRKYESVFFITLIISSFILLSALPFEATQRLADRNDMFKNIWENKLAGGDQVAQGVWALNSGGFWGQGLGKGLASLMPAYHTDMILESIGEEIGSLALIAIFIAFGLLVYRSILAARRTGKAFLFYLVAGIAIATMLQFFIIVGGTLGLIPLTGISVPFLSKGNAGIIVTMLSFLSVIIISNEKGDKIEMDYVKKNFDNVNAYAILFFMTVLVIFTITVCWYQFRSDKYIVKPALVLDRNGAWHYSYNPRIGVYLRKIESGNILDRNGVMLATSDKKTFSRARSKSIALGANPILYDEQLSRVQKRYYPFGADLLFWLGDYNKQIANEFSTGYSAEFRHYTLLKGFDVNYTTVQKTSDRFRENRFLPESYKEFELVKYDYSDLIPILKKGLNSELIATQNKKNKDIRLALDVLMNEKINSIIQNHAGFKQYRTSVVAMNASTGDVLASAMNPSPSYRDLKLISNIDARDYRTIFQQLFQNNIVVPQDLGITFNSRPGSTVKIIDAAAAFNQYGQTAANFTYFVYPGEVIHNGEPVNTNVDMRSAIVHSSNVYFIKLINDKNLQSSLFNLYDILGVNILNRGGYHFKRPPDYDTKMIFDSWNRLVSKGKDIFNNKKLMNTRRRFQSPYSDIAWGQGELKAAPLQLAKMAAAVANNGLLNNARFLYGSWNNADTTIERIQVINDSKSARLLGSFMKEQSQNVSTATNLTVYGKTGSPERDKVMRIGNNIHVKKVTDAWYTFYVQSAKLKAPIAFTIRIEEVGNSEYAKQLAIDLLKQLKAAGYL